MKLLLHVTPCILTIIIATSSLSLSSLSLVDAQTMFAFGLFGKKDEKKQQQQQMRTMGLSHPKLEQNSANDSNNCIECEYIIQLIDDIPDDDIESTIRQLITGTSGSNGSRDNTANIKYLYKHVFKGAAVYGITNDQLILILNSPQVQHVSRVRSNIFTKLLVVVTIIFYFVFVVK
jgi:hypothetical protein